MCIRDRVSGLAVKGAGHRSSSEVQNEPRSIGQARLGPASILATLRGPVRPGPSGPAPSVRNPGHQRVVWPAGADCRARAHHRGDGGRCGQGPIEGVQVSTPSRSELRRRGRTVLDDGHLRGSPAAGQEGAGNSDALDLRFSRPFEQLVLFRALVQLRPQTATSAALDPEVASFFGEFVGLQGFSACQGSGTMLAPEFGSEVEVRGPGSGGIQAGASPDCGGQLCQRGDVLDRRGQVRVTEGDPAV